MGTRYALDMATLATSLRADVDKMFDDSVNLMEDSVVRGSPITGSPGQPREDGDLIASWVTEKLSPTHAIIAVANDAVAAGWALQNENGIALPGGGPYNLRSSIGGRWSVEKSVAGWGRIVDAAIAMQGERLIGAN